MWFFFSSRRRHTRFKCDWSSDVCSSDLSSAWTRDSPPPAVREENIDVRLAAASPWSKRRNETAERALPTNVTARGYSYRERESRGVGKRGGSGGRPVH